VGGDDGCDDGQAETGAPRSPRSGPTSSRGATSSWPRALATGAAQVPRYTDDQRGQIVPAVTTPVTVTATADTFATVAATLVPIILALTLWFATLMVYLVRSAVPTGLA